MIYLSYENPGILVKLDKDQFSDFFKKNYHAACLVALRYMSDTSRAEDLGLKFFFCLSLHPLSKNCVYRSEYGRQE